MTDLTKKQPPHDSISGEGPRALSRGRGTHSLDRAEEAVEKRAGTAASTSSDSGAPPSNTAPSKYIKPKILRSAIDSLYLSYSGTLNESIELELERLKLCAQSDDPDERSHASVLVADHSFQVSGRGSKRYPFILSNQHYHLQVSRAQSSSMPLIYAQISSELLTLTGVDRAVNALNNLASVLGWDYEPSKVSRVDLCVDLDGFDGLPSIPLEHFICRSREKRFYAAGHSLTGLSVGEGGELMCRIYNKSVELEKSKKYYLHDVWKSRGASGIDVWRVEFQFKREVLRQLGVHWMSDLLELQNSLWEYGTQWLQFKYAEGKDTNRSRMTTYPFWEVVQSAKFNNEPPYQLRRISQSQKPDDDFLFLNGLGALTSYMADRGIDDIDEANLQYMKDCHVHHMKLSRDTGKTLTTYVREKVTQKRHKFGIKPKGQKHVPTEISGGSNG
jgi:hypothetical protein